jgi:diguanylate cyclase (GGDEF)-like protein/PAS domain S-box-containing protein
VISTAAPCYGDDGAFLGYVGSVIDVDERRRAEEALRQSEGRLRRAQEAGGIGDWELDLATEAVYWSDRLYRLLAVEAGQVRPCWKAMRELIHPDDRDRVAREVEATAAGLGPLDTEFRVLRPDGAIRWLASRGELMLGADGRPERLVGVCFDQTERKEAEERIWELALHDPLTGLPNRRMLLSVLTRELARARREACSLSLFLVDLDDFKGINDTLGHTASDELLVLTARRLQACLRDGDHVARLGGDEFAVVAVGAGGPDAPAALAGRIVQVLGQPAELRGAEIRPGASVDIVIWPSDEADAEALLARADLALYAAKEAGRGTWRFFEAAMQERARTVASLDRDLRRALERGEFVLHFQPIVELQAFQLRGFEALLRWRHPDHDLTAPGEFLPRAERNRLIVPLTYWAIAEALRQAAAWRAGGAADAYVTVNLALPVLAGDGLVEHVGARLRAEGLPADALLAEVTEGAMAEGDRVTVMLAQLRGTGVRIGIDDFGAGYSSLARLRDLPFDLLKIDRAFLAGSSRKEGAILRAVVELARSLDVPTVAEGVETPAQLALLRRVGACCTQGFLIAPPMPADAIIPWVREWQQSRLRVMHTSSLNHTESARTWGAL